MILPAFNSPHERQLWIVSQLKLRGTSLAEVARKHGVTRSSLHAAFHIASDKAEKIIAAEFDIPQEELFPERYAGGQRIFQVRTRKTAA